MNCAFEFDLPDGKRRMITFEVRHWITNHEAEIGTKFFGTPEPKRSTNEAKLGPVSGSHNTVGNIFYGSKGYLAMGDEDADTYAVWLGRDQEQQQAPVHGGSELAHFQNFIDCVVSRNKSDLNAPIEEGHISAGLMHLANASYRLGRTINFNPETQEVIGDEEAACSCATEIADTGSRLSFRKKFKKLSSGRSSRTAKYREFRALGTSAGIGRVDWRITILVGIVSCCGSRSGD